MKKICVLFAILFATLSSFAQDSKTYVITRSEWYLYNEDKEEWMLQTQNRDVKINMVTYKNVINIQAATPTLFRLEESSKKPIEGKDFTGLSYSALECVEMRDCTVHIVVLDENKNFFLFSVIYNLKGEKVNLRFYAKLD